MSRAGRTEADFMARARAGWGETPPDWIVALAQACQRETQSAVARRLGVSGSQVSQTLSRTYRGITAKLEQAVRGALMGETVECPVLGEIGRDRCLAEQGMPRIPTSSVRMRLHRACRGGCPHSRIAKDRP